MPVCGEGEVYMVIRGGGTVFETICPSLAAPDGAPEQSKSYRRRKGTFLVRRIRGEHHQDGLWAAEKHLSSYAQATRFALVLAS